MKVITGRVVDETDQFHLTPAEEDELVEALHDIRSGRFEDGRELLRELKGSSGR